MALTRKTKKLRRERALLGRLWGLGGKERVGGSWCKGRFALEKRGVWGIGWGGVRRGFGGEVVRLFGKLGFLC